MGGSAPLAVKGERQAGEMRQQVFAQLVNDFRGRAALRLEMQGDMGDALFLLAFPQLNQGVTACAQDATGLQGVIGVTVQVEQGPVAVGFVTIAGAGGLPAIDDLGQGFRVGDIGDHPVGVLPNPLQRLPCIADHQRGQASTYRLGHQIDLATELAVERRAVAGPVPFGGRTDHRQGVAKAGGAIVEIQPECRVFDRSVAGRQTQDEPSPQQLIDAGCLFGDDQRVAQRQHDTGRANGNLAGGRSQVACIYQGVEDLPDIAKVGVVEGHVAQPDGGKPCLIHLAGHGHMVAQGRGGAVGVAFQRRNEAEGQMPGLEHSGVTWVVLERLRKALGGSLGRHTSSLVCCLPRRSPPGP